MAYVEESFKTFTVGGADIPAYTAVKLSAGVVVAAAAGTDLTIGVTDYAAKAGGTVAVRLRSASGTSHIKVGSGSVAAGDAITSDSNGLAVTTTTAGNQLLGYAIEAKTTGTLVEFLPSVAKY